MPEKISHISVRELVEFVLRRGDINSSYTGSKRAVEGTKIHSRLQKKHIKETFLKGYVYDSEVSLNITAQYKDFTFEIDGRADGAVEIPKTDKTERILHIEEIKSTVYDTETIIPDYEHWHFAQAKCYGYMYGVSENFSDVIIHITYCQTETYDTVSFEKKYTINELKEYFYYLIDLYYEWAKMSYDFMVTGNESIKILKFPFETYRKGQREFAGAVYKTLISKKKLFAQAPTGTGKTVSSVFPALKYIGETELSERKIFYATAKTITRQTAESILSKMSEKGLKIKSITITAKEKICFTEEKVCTPKKCPYAKGHFDRINNALKELLKSNNSILREDIEMCAMKHKVCPFELAFDAAVFSDFIICDYNYIFDPKTQIKRFFGDGAKGNYIVLVDEAHNLVDRSREMYSAVISKEDISFVLKELNSKITPLYKSLSKIKSYIVKKEYDIDGYKAEVTKEYPEELMYMLMDSSEKANKWLTENEENAAAEEVLSIYFKILDFIRISEFFGSNYVVLSEKKDSDVTLKLFCIDPSKNLAEEQKKFVSTIFFSATLTPVNYFMDILGGSPKENSISILSPFNKENLKLFIDGKISTKYKDRKNSLRKISERLYEMATREKGNYFAFFPSYEYMESAAEIFINEHPEIKCQIQSRSLTEREKERYLDAFKPNPEASFLSFAVMGGVFSEGIDLTGNRLIGAAIIGVGIPLITMERNIIKEYYDKKNGSGFDYAYTYPGFNKVLQAAGRVIRTETDTGTIMLIDSRFNSIKYINMFPCHWKNFKSI